MTEQELLQAIAELITECKLKDKRLAELEYMVKDLQYQLDRSNNQLKQKNAWEQFDPDGRC
jgi:Tfp pilus assembly protein FimV